VAETGREGGGQAEKCVIPKSWREMCGRERETGRTKEGKGRIPSINRSSKSPGDKKKGIGILHCDDDEQFGCARVFGNKRARGRRTAET
jgi:hypothetical protein